jgi:hypothetical protein
MSWIESIRHWRALTQAERHRRHSASLPRSAARRVAFEGEAVDQAMLEAEHGHQPIPPVMSTRIPAGRDR